MKCEFCGSFPREAGAVECAGCGEPLPPGVKVEFSLSGILRPNSPGSIRLRLSNEGAELTDLHVELNSALFVRPGRHHVAKLPAYPHDLSVRDDIVVPICTRDEGSQPMTVMIAFRRGPELPLVAYNASAEIEVKGGESTQNISIKADKIYAPDIRTGEFAARQWNTVSARYDAAATQRVVARSIHQARMSCPYCQQGIEEGFNTCPGCGLEVPSYLKARKESHPTHLGGSQALAGVTLSCMNTGVRLCICCKPQLAMGRKPDWNDIQLLVLPRNEVNDALSERISRDHCWLKIEEEQPVLEYKSPVNLQGTTKKRIPLEEEARYPIADVLALAIKPFFAEGPMARFHLATRVTPVNSGCSTGSTQIVHHLLLKRWVNVGIDNTGAPHLAGPGEEALCRLVHLDHSFWIEPLDQAQPILVDNAVVPVGEIAPVLAGRRIRCGRLAFFVESPPPSTPETTSP